jgi:hypothetical protein
MDDPRRERGRDARTTTPKTDPDTGAGHRPSTTQPRDTDDDRSRVTEEKAAPPAEPNERERPPV